MLGNTFRVVDEVLEAFLGKCTATFHCPALLAFFEVASCNTHTGTSAPVQPAEVYPVRPDMLISPSPLVNGSETHCEKSSCWTTPTCRELMCSRNFLCVSSYCENLSKAWSKRTNEAPGPSGPDILVALESYQSICAANICGKRIRSAISSGFYRPPPPSRLSLRDKNG